MVVPYITVKEYKDCTLFFRKDRYVARDNEGDVILFRYSSEGMMDYIPEAWDAMLSKYNLEEIHREKKEIEAQWRERNTRKGD